jgi:wyosine [tRNA(Phe)-imidazoG37] synthetase (radical SAM superfamily)
VPIHPVLDELKTCITQGIDADYITLSGSGEPTLHSELGDLIDGIRTITDIPVAIITNSTLLHREDVRGDCAKADVVLPSLDAPDQETFLTINHPCAELTFEQLIHGLIAFRNLFMGPLWLEIFLVKGINTSPSHIRGFQQLIKDIGPDKIQLNTAVRPTARAEVSPLSLDEMQGLARQLGPTCEIIASHPLPAKQLPSHHPDLERILSTLQRRPCSIDDICNGLGITREKALACVTTLQKNQRIITDQQNDITYYKAV